MKLKKPKFWDKNKPNFISNLLSPLAKIVELKNKFQPKSKNKFKDIRTICVGNIYLGGTGKTSIAIEIKKILDKAKELEAKMKESQEKIKNIRVEGISGSNSIKIILDGEGEMQKIEISDEILKEEKSIVEDLIVAAHNNAKTKLKSKTTEEISKATGGLGIPGFKWPL